MATRTPASLHRLTSARVPAATPLAASERLRFPLMASLGISQASIVNADELRERVAFAEIAPGEEFASAAILNLGLRASRW